MEDAAVGQSSILAALLLTVVFATMHTHSTKTNPSCGNHAKQGRLRQRLGAL